MDGHRDKALVEQAARIALARVGLNTTSSTISFSSTDAILSPHARVFLIHDDNTVVER